MKHVENDWYNQNIQEMIDIRTILNNVGTQPSLTRLYQRYIYLETLFSGFPDKRNWNV